MKYHRMQGPAQDRFVSAPISRVPPDWNDARMVLDVAFDPARRTRAIHHRLVNPATGQAGTDFPESLFTAATELHVIFSKFQQGWKREIVALGPPPAGRCRNVEATFEYGTPA